MTEPETRDAATGPDTWSDHAGHWKTLVKLRLTSLVSLAAFASALLGVESGTGGEGVLRAVEAAFWITLSAASGAVFNQILEREVDKRMERTRSRPLPQGAVSARRAGAVGALLGILAVVGLAWRFNWFAAGLALASLVIYVFIYTPMKRRSSLNTVVGAIAGAAPAAIGYVAMTGTIGLWAGTLFAVTFAWQFPHFMAIAWIHREDYRRAGMQMVPALPGGEGPAGLLALGCCLTMIPVSVFPTLQGTAGFVYGAGALILGVGLTVFAARFARSQEHPQARALFLSSLVYLPALFLMIFVDAGLYAGPTP